MTILNAVWFVSGLVVGAVVVAVGRDSTQQCTHCGTVSVGPCPHCYMLKPEIRPLREQQDSSPLTPPGEEDE